MVVVVVVVVAVVVGEGLGRSWGKKRGVVACWKDRVML